MNGCEMKKFCQVSVFHCENLISFQKWKADLPSELRILCPTVFNKHLKNVNFCEETCIAED